LALGLDPTLVLIPFALLFALGVNQLARHSRLPNDALLNIVYSSSLALAVLALSLVHTSQASLQQLLFGDILAVSWTDLALILLLLVGCSAYLLLTRRSQILLTLDASLAISRGVAAGLHRLLFVLVLAMVVAISVKAVGVLLISAFVVIPACAARLVSTNFTTYTLLAAGLGAGCALVGLLASASWDLPSGPSVVVVQLLAFLIALALGDRRWRRAAGRAGRRESVAAATTAGSPDPED